MLSKGIDYDVIVVGSGLGGLSCATMLSNRGHKVLVLEHHSQVGGYAGSFQRRGFIFNNGAEEITGFWENGPFDRLIKEAGLKTDDFFLPHRTGPQYIINGEKHAFPNGFDGITAKLCEMFPDEEKNILAFMDGAQQALEGFFPYADIRKVSFSDDPDHQTCEDAKLRGICVGNSDFYDWISVTVAGKLNEYFDNPDLISFLNTAMNYHGIPPEKTSAFILLRSYSFFKYGYHISKGGIQRFSNALADRIKSHGGEVLLKHTVDKIVIDDDRVIGVKVGEKIFKSPIVVSNAHALNTYFHLIDPAHLAPSYVDYIKSLKPSYSSVMVYLGVDMDLSGLPSIIHEVDHGYGASVRSGRDTSSMPHGQSAIVLFRGANWEDFPERGSAAYARAKKEAADHLIQKAEALFPDLSERIIVQDAATPRTLARYTLSPKGTGEGFENTIETVMPSIKTPVKGLYQVGATVFPGAGLELAAISGMICAKGIRHWQPKRSK